ncbi:DNA-binding transcriptional activator of the SARP family [Lentzea fradiae]|uniref:DNA-binding transcriptional activator of the SARP family n=1 Tax=Lentzea fradiae TaxID=200378 RepID=A0A1G7YCY2_9PSEU|nr:BTAD domain-containing putative transcriptional regulator [Lentzea fradiae]SDG94418.1 DNA-binding transcriptional activator of the SARP family [Lentzea fradiae]
MGMGFEVLGDVGARVDGRWLDLGHARQRCVLAVLALEANRVVPADRLIDRVWGENAPHGARTTLYGYLYRLRRLLPEGVIVRRGGGYLLAVPPEAVDAHRFTALVERARATGDLALFDEALALWRGEALAGLDTPWLTEVAAGLDRARLAAELDRADLALAQGKHLAVAAQLPALAEANPLDERLAAQLIVALHASGRRAEALEHYHLVRSRLVEELGTEPGELLREVHLRVLGEGHSPVPRQLPGAPTPFAGRVEELAELDKMFGATNVVAVGGTGGVGKTWLALCWAHRGLDRFPDGQLHVDLHGFDPVTGPTPPATALRRLLDGLGVPAEGDADVLAARFRSAVAGKRLLVLLDNAQDEDQVVPLLPGDPGCAVLITSRRQLSGLAARHGAQLLSLGTMSPPESAGVLAGHLGADRLAANPVAVEAILDHCAGLPLALGIAASRAAVHQDLPLSVLAEEFQEDRLDSLRSVFASSVRALDSEAAEVFRSVAAAPGPDIEVRSAAALTGLPKVRTALRRLENAHLVLRRGAARYRMHDLVRLHATELGADLAAVRRLVEFYVETAWAADSVFNKPTVGAPGKAVPLEFANAEEARAWLSAEHACLLAAQAWAERHDMPDAVWHLAWFLDQFHWRHGLLAAHLEVWQAAGRVDVDDWRRAQGHRRYSHVLMRAGRFDEALDELNAALVVHERTGSALDQGHVFHDIAAILGHSGDLARAIEHAERSLPFYRAAENATQWEANALNTLGWFLAKAGEHERGRVHCAQAVALCRAAGYPDGQAAAHDSLGHIAHTTGAHRRALGHYRQALRLRRELGDPYEEADALLSLGKVHTALGEHAQAHELWRTAAGLYRGQGRQTELTEVTRLLEQANAPVDAVVGRGVHAALR